MKVRPIHREFAAEIGGIELGRFVDHAVVDTIWEARPSPGSASPTSSTLIKACPRESAVVKALPTPAARPDFINRNFSTSSRLQGTGKGRLF
jgi:hypothetical protein